jgi:hypothetical protein
VTMLTAVRRFWVACALLIVTLIVLGAVGLIERFSTTTFVFLGVQAVLSALLLWGPRRITGRPSNREREAPND